MDTISESYKKGKQSIYNTRKTTTMNKAFVLHYYSDNERYKLYSTDYPLLVQRLKEWKLDELATNMDYISEITYNNVEELLQEINSLNSKDYKPKLSEEQALRLYDQWLDCQYPMNIGAIKIRASEALKNQDYDMYQRVFDDYLNDSLGEDYDLSDIYK